MSPTGDEGRQDGRGLCGRCVHAREVRNRRGSTFVLCERSKTDPGYARYPVLPVLVCGGYERE